MTRRVVPPVRAALHRALDSYLREHHRPAILGSVDEHLNSQTPLLAIMFAFREPADEICSVPQRPGYFPDSQENRFRKRAIPRHDTHSTILKTTPFGHEPAAGSLATAN
jgi:hypothetical protein